MATKTFKIGLSNTDKQNMAQDVYERVLDLTFAEYDSGGTYNEGDFVIYNDVLYRCIADNVTGTWDVSKWEQATLQDLLDDVEGAVASVNDKANVDGNYPTMTVGFAEELTPYGSNSGVEDDTPFVFQTTGGDSDVSSSAKLLSLDGKSYTLNQALVVGALTDTVSNVAITWSTDGIIKYNGTANATNDIGFITGTMVSNSNPSIQGHKYLIKLNLKGSIGTGYFSCASLSYGIFADGIYTANSGSFYGNFHCVSGESYDFTVQPQIFDLTLMFGAGNEPTSVAEFNRLFPNAYYEYGNSLVSSKSSAIKNVGYNAFDGEWVIGGINDSGGESANTYNAKSKNYIKVIPSQEYSFENTTFSANTNSSGMYVVEYDGDKNFIKRNALGHFNGTNLIKKVTLTDNTHYVKLVLYIDNYNFTNNFPTSFDFHLTWDESRTGYEPYQEYTYNLPNIELRSAGSVYDSITPDGTLVRRVGVVDLGTLTWSGSSGYFYSNSSNDIRDLIKKPATSSDKANVLCSTLLTQTYDDVNSNITGIAVSTSGSLIIYNTAWSTSSQITGTLIYELATPTTTQDDAYKYQENMIVDDFGTQEFIGNGIPQGNQFFYAVDYKAFIDSLGGREDIDYDASEIVSHTELSALDTIVYENLKGMLRHQLASEMNIDFANTAVIDLGTLNYGSYDSDGKRFGAEITGMAPVSGTATIPNILCPIYKSLSISDFDGDKTVDMTIRGHSSIGYIFIRNLSYTDATEFKNAMKGVILAYEKA